MLKKRKKELIIALILSVMIFLTINKSNKEKAEKEAMNAKMSEILLKIDTLDSLSFNEAFSKMHHKYGENYIFRWNGSEYTTNIEK